MFPSLPAAAVQLPFCFKKVWEATRGKHCLKHETLATTMGMTPPQLSQQLNDHGHPSLKRFFLLLIDPTTRGFAEEFLNACFAELGIASAVDPFLPLLKQMFALTVKTHMVKAQLSTRTEDERKIA